MNIIILGDRYKRGMKSKGCVGLIKINNNTNIFQQQYRSIKKIFPNSKLIYVSGFESKKMSSFLSKNRYDNVENVQNNTFSTTNVGFSLSLVEQYLVENCLILDGMTNISNKLLMHIQKQPDQNLLLTGNKHGDIGCILNGQLVDSLGIDLDHKIYDIAYITQLTAQKLQKIIKNEYHYAFLFEIINTLIDLGEKFNHKPFNRPQLCYR